MNTTDIVLHKFSPSPASALQAQARAGLGVGGGLTGPPGSHNSMGQPDRGMWTKATRCKGCGFPIARGCDYCGECLCEEDGL
jgi:hypothetical protein